MTLPVGVPPAPHPRGSALTTRLARRGFLDTARASAAVERLQLDDGSDEADLVLADLARSADPDLALATLERLAAAHQHPADLLCALRFHTGLRERLLAVLGASAALGDHLVRHPTDVDRLADDSQLDVRPTALGLRRELLRTVGADPEQPLPWGTGGATAGGATARDATAATVQALTTAYRRRLLLVAARDLTGHCDLGEVAAELADVAAAALDAALAIAAAGLPPGTPPVRLAVVGMGKCGGRELNYASDVDVVFVAEPLDADTDIGTGTGTGTDAALRTATRLASGLIAACAPLFPVDAALRPEGKAGPLVRTLASHDAYYRRWASSWELQALLKARPVAGDLALGRAYVAALEPLVWTDAARPDVPRETQQLRRRVEADLARRHPADAGSRELKLGPGGLRDVEFSVQLLQLVHGRSDPGVRSGTTLAALDALTSGGYVGRDDAAPLAAAYTWLRTTEHRLQLQHLRRTHTVPPPGDPALRWVARAMTAAPDAEADFVRTWRRHATVVRRLHEKLFYRPLLTAVARLPSADARLSPAAAANRLQALGFAQTRQALAHLEALTSGVSRRATIQRTLLPVLLGWFAEEADPDSGLLAFRRLSDALGDTPWYLTSLRDEGQVAERLAHLLARSRYVADLLARAPEAMLTLAEDGALALRQRVAVEAELLAVTRRTDDWEGGVVSARGIRRDELLRTAFADLLGLATGPQVQAALSDLAGATVAAALDTAQRKVSTEHRGPLPVRLAVIALGRLGSRELSYASDADVVFVHEALGHVPEHVVSQAAHAVAEETRRLLARPAPDPPLRLDTALRPEGRGGLPSLTLPAYARYHATRARVWEQQALLRASPLAGDPELAQRFLAQVAPLRWPSSLSPAAELEVLRLRDRVQTERVARGLRPGERWRDLKLGPGGLVDVEWVAQLLQLRHAHAVPGLRVTGTPDALAAARDAGLLGADDAAVLATAHTTAARLRDAVVLVSGARADVLPEEGRTLEGVRRVAGPAAVAGWREQAAGARAVADALLHARVAG